MHDIENKYKEEQLLFLASAKKLLPFYDWNLELLKAIETECGFIEDYHFVLFPNGMQNIVKHFENLHDELMLNHLQNHMPADSDTDKTRIRIKDKIALALKYRIKNSYPKIIHSKNLAYLKQPDNIVLAPKIAWNSCDKIWQYAGDQSLDFNYYTKRSLLVGAYISAIIFYLKDTSENDSATDDFIDNTINKINSLSKITKYMKLPQSCQ